MILRAICVVLLGGAAGLGARGAAAEPCTIAAVGEEVRLGMPAGLLVAISIVETGARGRPAAFAVNIDGRSYMASSERAALAIARPEGHGFIENAAVGCMQLLVASHLRHFNPAERILDPASNVRRAAQYLAQAKARYGNWTSAVGRYHGGNIRQNREYTCKVWNALRSLAPASAMQLDGKPCGVMPRAAVDRDVARIAHETRQRLAAAKTTAPAPRGAREPGVTAPRGGP